MPVLSRSALLLQSVHSQFRFAASSRVSKQTSGLYPRILRACRPHLSFNRARSQSHDGPPTGQSAAPLTPASPNAARRLITTVLGWAILLPLSLSMLPGLAHAHTKPAAVPVAVPAACQPAKASHAAVVNATQVPLCLQGAVASLSISSFGHLLQSLHTAYFVKMLTYQAQRVRSTSLQISTHFAKLVAKMVESIFDETLAAAVA